MHASPDRMARRVTAPEALLAELVDLETQSEELLRHISATNRTATSQALARMDVRIIELQTQLGDQVARAAHGNELQRRSQGYETQRHRTLSGVPPPRAHPERTAELDWQYAIADRRRNAIPTLLPSRHNPRAPTPAALAWAAAAAQRDARDPPSNDIPAGEDCCICFSRPKTVLCLPCCHCTCCGVCWEREARSARGMTCPLCRTQVQNTERLSPSALREISQGSEILHPAGRLIRLGAKLL
jgi:hypothetical protein